MKRFLLAVFAVTFCNFEPSFAQERPVDGAPWDNTAIGLDRSVVAFVGEKIFVEERNLEETMEFTLPDGQVVTRVLPQMSDRYEARYKIIEVIGGDYQAPEIDFEAYDHYGRPYFPKINPVLLFAFNANGEWILRRNLTSVIHQTTDGDWAICGGLPTSSWTDKFELSASTYEEPIGFLDPPKLPSGKPCVSGVRASQLFAFQIKTHFAPERRRIFCNREMGESDSINVGTGSAPDADLKAQVHAACVGRLEAKDNL